MIVKWLAAPLLLAVLFAGVMVVDAGAAADYAMLYAVLFVILMAPAALHVERRHR